MRILGLADGRDASAALVVDGALVAWETEARVGDPDHRGLPWRAAEAVLASVGLRRDEVDHVAVAGRFTPALILRRHPGLRRIARDPFSPSQDAHALLQAFFRESGVGASEADRARTWVRDSLRAHGYRPRRVQMIDVHRALAAAAYRCQPDDDVLVLSLHPMGDGVSVAVHRGEGGQLERLWEQRGMSALHVHLQRCVAALDLELATAMDRLSTLAGRGEPDPALLDGLESWLRPKGPRLAGARYPIPRVRLPGSQIGMDPLYAALRAAPREDAAASLVENLRRAVRGLLSFHVARERVRDVFLAGAAVQDPRVVAAAAEVEVVHTVGSGPFGGYSALAVGAAATTAGLAPHRLDARGLGPEITEADAGAALEGVGVTPRRRRDAARWLAERLEAGEAVARLVDRGGLGRWGLGRAAVMVRADRADAVERARAALGRSPEEAPGCLAIDLPDSVVQASRLGPALELGTAAVSVGASWASTHGAVVAPDGRVLLARLRKDADPVLVEALERLRSRTGCGAVACFPLAAGDEGRARTAEQGARTWRRAGLDALMLGPLSVTREGR